MLRDRRVVASSLAGRHHRDVTPAHFDTASEQTEATDDRPTLSHPRSSSRTPTPGQATVLAAGTAAATAAVTTEVAAAAASDVAKAGVGTASVAILSTPASDPGVARRWTDTVTLLPQVRDKFYTALVRYTEPAQIAAMCRASGIPPQPSLQLAVVSLIDHTERSFQTATPSSNWTSITPPQITKQIMVMERKNDPWLAMPNIAPLPSESAGFTSGEGSEETFPLSEFARLAAVLASSESGRSFLANIIKSPQRNPIAGDGTVDEYWRYEVPVTFNCNRWRSIVDLSGIGTDIRPLDEPQVPRMFKTLVVQYCDSLDQFRGYYRNWAQSDQFSLLRDFVKTLPTIDGTRPNGATKSLILFTAILRGCAPHCRTKKDFLNFMEGSHSQKHTEDVTRRGTRDSLHFGDITQKRQCRRTRNEMTLVQSGGRPPVHSAPEDPGTVDARDSRTTEGLPRTASRNGSQRTLHQTAGQWSKRLRSNNLAPLPDQSIEIIRYPPTDVTVGTSVCSLEHNQGTTPKVKKNHPRPKKKQDRQKCSTAYTDEANEAVAHDLEDNRRIEKQASQEYLHFQVEDRRVRMQPVTRGADGVSHAGQESLVKSQRSSCTSRNSQLEENESDKDVRGAGKGSQVEDQLTRAPSRTQNERYCGSGKVISDFDQQCLSKHTKDPPTTRRTLETQKARSSKRDESNVGKGTTGEEQRPQRLLQGRLSAKGIKGIATKVTDMEDGFPTADSRPSGIARHRGNVSNEGDSENDLLDPVGPPNPPPTDQRQTEDTGNVTPREFSGLDENDDDTLSSGSPPNNQQQAVDTEASKQFSALDKPDQAETQKLSRVPLRTTRAHSTAKRIDGRLQSKSPCATAAGLLERPRNTVSDHAISPPRSDDNAHSTTGSNTAQRKHASEPNQPPIGRRHNGVFFRRRISRQSSQRGDPRTPLVISGSKSLARDISNDEKGAKVLRTSTSGADDLPAKKRAKKTRSLLTSTPAATPAQRLTSSSTALNEAPPADMTGVPGPEKETSLEGSGRAVLPVALEQSQPMVRSGYSRKVSEKTFQATAPPIFPATTPPHLQPPPALALAAPPTPPSAAKAVDSPAHHPTANLPGLVGENEAKAQKERAERDKVLVEVLHKIIDVDNKIPTTGTGERVALRDKISEKMMRILDRMP